MNKPCMYLCVFCLGVLVGQGEVNPIMNLVTILALLGAVLPIFEEDAPEEEERRETKTRLVHNPYYNRYKQ